MSITIQAQRKTNKWVGRAITRRGPIRMKTAAAALLAAGALGWAAPSAAQTVAAASTATEILLGDLEKAFWACDFAATNSRVDAGTAMACGNVGEALKLRKFDGDFNALLAWWRQHKEAEHLALATAHGDARVSRAPTAPR